MFDHVVVLDESLSCPHGHRVGSFQTKSFGDASMDTYLVDGPQRSIGYTFGMKTAVSIPDEVFQRVERFARRAGRSRSEVFSAAIQEYVARHAPDEVTDAMDRVCADIPDQPDPFARAAARRVMARTEW